MQHVYDTQSGKDNVEPMNDYKESNNQPRYNMIHKLNQFKTQTEELKQQVIDLKTDNKLKDKLLHIKSQENNTLKREIEQLKKQLLSLSNKDNNKIKPYKKRNNKKESYENNIINNNNRIIITQEQKGKKIFEGYMFKKSKFSSEFQNRYFILYANNTLSYYQNIGDHVTCNTSMGDINLYTIIHIKQENENIFNLITPTQTFTLKCLNNKEYHRWIQIIKLRVSPKIISAGWLYKKADNNKSWKLRYYKLCELIAIELDQLHYELRYYEDEECQKYKGHINCTPIEEIKILPNTSIQKYGKDKVFQLLSQTKTYIFAAKDSKSRNTWYKSLKKVLFDDDVPFLSLPLPTNKSVPVPLFPSNEAQACTSGNGNINHSKDTSKSKSMLIRILEPISEKHIKQFEASPLSPVSPLLIISNNNADIDNKEWHDIDCIAAVTPNITPIGSDGSDEDESSVDTERLMVHNLFRLSSMNRTFSNQSMYSYEPDSEDEFDPVISYMSDNSLMLMDMNDEMNKLGHIINDTLDSMEMGLTVKNIQVYEEMSFGGTKTNGCDEVIQSPVKL